MRAPRSLAEVSELRASSTLLTNSRSFGKKKKMNKKILMIRISYQYLTQCILLSASNSLVIHCVDKQIQIDWSVTMIKEIYKLPLH